jgi:hypothetical protein
MHIDADAVEETVDLSGNGAATDDEDSAMLY